MKINKSSNFRIYTLYKYSKLLSCLVLLGINLNIIQKSYSEDPNLNSQIKNLKVFPGEYIIDFKESKLPFHSDTFFANNTDTFVEQLKSIKSFNDQINTDHTNNNQTVLELLKPISSSAILIKKEYSLNSNSPKTLGFTKAYTEDFNPNDSFCNDLVNSGKAKSCSPNFVVNISLKPNDTSIDSIWGLKTDVGIDAEKAWDFVTGSSEVVVGVVDTGIDFNHTDLKDNIWTNPGEIPDNGIDDDQNGYIDDVHGANFIDPTVSPLDDNGHGTHVSGTIGGVGNNGFGISGVSWKVKLMALKFLDSNGSGSLAGAIEALNYARMMKLRGTNIYITNNSWGGSGYSKALEDAISKLGSAGIIAVVAAGNESNDNDSNPQYPASFNLSNIISVAALDKSGSLAYFSNFGNKSVQIAAPGDRIYSTWPNNSYQVLSGTSMATPYVAGALALVYSDNKNLTPQNAISLILNHSRKRDSLTGKVFDWLLIKFIQYFYKR